MTASVAERPYVFDNLVPWELDQEPFNCESVPWAAWADLLYSREVVNAAGRALVESDSLSQDDANVISNWRSVHAYPLLAIQSILRYWAPRCAGTPLISQRIKRLPSIKAKLHILDYLKLTQMQDIGGCRVVVRTAYEVSKIVGCLKESRMRHELVKENDYITAPKESGYRSHHLIYRFVSSNKRYSLYNGLKIEMQLRTTAQHAWATAVEIASTFSREPLKSSVGDAEWLYFFKLMGSDMARRERRAIIPGTPTTRADLRREIIFYEKKLDVVNHLASWRFSLQSSSSSKMKEAYYFLVQTFPEPEARVDVLGFTKDELQKATSLYLEAEEQALSNKVASDSVLVSVDNLRSLKRAYPNYFGDTAIFIAAIERAIA